MGSTLLELKDTKMYYPVKVRENRKFFTVHKFVRAVDGVSFTVEKGTTLGIVGESGCGKSTIGKMIVKLLHPTAGNIYYEGKDIFQLSAEEDRQFKEKVQIIFQDPYSSLDPRFYVGRIIAEPMVGRGFTAEQRKQRVLELMQEVGMKEEQYGRYPHEFSGGQRQRIGIARALALNPSLIVCDEPVSALDVSIQAQVLNLMQQLRKKHNLTYVFISHNLSVVKHFCDEIVVMYLGNIVERAKKDELFHNHQHPYTEALLYAVPVPDPDVESMQNVITGEVPSTMEEIPGCVFSSRCKYASEECRKNRPSLREVSPGHFVACHKR